MPTEANLTTKNLKLIKALYNAWFKHLFLQLILNRQDNNLT